MRSRDQEPQRPRVERSLGHPLTYQGQVAGAGAGVEGDPRRQSIVTSPTVTRGQYMPSQQDMTGSRFSWSIYYRSGFIPTPPLPSAMPTNLLLLTPNLRL